MVGSRREKTLTDVEQRTADRLERVIRPVLCDTPSPDFLARARRRIAERKKPATRWLPWYVAAGLSAAMLLLAIVAFHDRQPNIVSRLDDSHRAAIRPTSPDQAADSQVVVGSTAVDHTVRLVRARGRRTPSGVTKQKIAPANIRAEVLVPAGQLEAIQQFVERMRMSPVDAQPLTIAADVPSAPDLSTIVIAPLKIEPLVGPAATREVRGRNEHR